MGKPLLLMIRDGWGIGKGGEGDAVSAANTPNMDRLLAEYPTCLLDAAGEAVGLRAGSQGSSEVGHLNMGAGRIVEQEVRRVDTQLASGKIFQNERFQQAVRACKAGARFHLMGLVQDQGVHATQDHFFAFLDHLASEGVKDVVVHFFSDGRDTPPQSAQTYLEAMEAQFAKCGIGRIGSVMGRFWAMDRGENWDRTEKAYRALLEGLGYKAHSACEAIEDAYRRAEAQKAAGEDNAETDEFILPTIIVNDNDEPTGLIRPGDAVLHMNYRQDRAIQLTKAFVDQDFCEFDRGTPPDVIYMGLTQYYDDFPYPLVAPMDMSNLLGEVLGANGLRQLRIAEYQKYRHVTSFFNGKRLEAFAGEDRIQVDSITIPEDQKPEMSAPEVTDLVVCAVEDGIAAVRDKARSMDMATLELPPNDAKGAGDDLTETYDVIVLNYANGDMVGHTGVFDAARKAIETVDECLGRVVEAVLEKGGSLIITADHGNAEQMLDDSGKVQTAHTTNLVHCVLVGEDLKNRTLVKEGKLSDIAVTMLELLGVDAPQEMTAESLLA